MGKWAKCQACKQDLTKGHARFGVLHGAYGGKPAPGGSFGSGNSYRWWCIDCMTAEHVRSSVRWSKWTAFGSCQISRRRRYCQGLRVDCMLVSLKPKKMRWTMSKVWTKKILS